MIRIHRNEERGKAEHGWLHSRFSFSFAEYYDPKRMGFGALRVINDDIIEAGEGFGLHPHRDMEIVSIVTKGTLLHKDSEGHQGAITAGEIQYMSAASGVFHSEFAAPNEAAHLFQVWIKPDQTGGTPLYRQRSFQTFNQNGRWLLLVSPEGKEESIAIKQQAFIYSAKLAAHQSLSLPETTKNRGILLLVVEGKVVLGSHTLERRDEAQIVSESALSIEALEDAHLLRFDVLLS
jgi:hypothetical protein